MSTIETLKGQNFTELPTIRNHDTITGLSDVNSIDLIEHNIKIKRQETISLDSINLEEALIDNKHSHEIGEDMKKSWGQTTPITVRAKLENGSIVYDIIDGFHRTEGRIKEGFQDISATVLYGCSDEEMYNQRILAANSVKSLQFARLVKWVTNSFNTTEFAQKGLTACQAFAITINNSGRSYTANFSSEEIANIKEWVTSRSKNWGRSPVLIYQDLLVAKDTAPDLIEQVRNVDGGSERARTLTKEKLKQILEIFPGEENYVIQRTINKFVNENRYSKIQIQNTVNYLKTKYCPSMIAEEVVDLLKTIPEDILNQKMETTDPKVIEITQLTEKLNKAYQKLTDTQIIIRNQDKKNEELEEENNKIERELSVARKSLKIQSIKISELHRENDNLKTQTPSTTQPKNYTPDNSSQTPSKEEKTNHPHLIDWIKTIHPKLDENQTRIVLATLYKQGNVFDMISGKTSRGLFSKVLSIVINAVQRKLEKDYDNRSKV